MIFRNIMFILPVTQRVLDFHNELVDIANAEPPVDHLAHKKDMLELKGLKRKIMKRPAGANSCEAIEKKHKQDDDDATEDMLQMIDEAENNYQEAIDALTCGGGGGGGAVALAADGGGGDVAVAEDCDGDSDCVIVEDAKPRSSCVALRNLPLSGALLDFLYNSTQIEPPTTDRRGNTAYIRFFRERQNSYYQLRTGVDEWSSKDVALLQMSQSRYGVPGLKMLSSCLQLYELGWPKEALQAVKKHCLMEMA